ncbi:MAG: single-stranded-DNA-specific exonuclease RecJ [Lactobacillaceae bacterium]|jgi:single-stranded-DNA-specific exonuclease|nr:single-stranded-DNA-specific exonuclease RecJ [Lactobacillaceae bacterium]
MIEPQYKWQFPTQMDAASIKELTETLGVSELIAQILVSRGIDNVEKAKTFLQPSIEQLNDPAALYDMDRAVERITTAIEQGDRIVVYGDYDVDGITATAIMTLTLEIMGADVSYFVPNRFKDGYGPNLAQYQRLAEDGMQLLITVDNGVSGQAEIAWLMDNGIDVIVTDHHELPSELPAAVAVVHPRHPAGNYPFPGLSGAGVAFKVASALLEAPADELIDLAAIGTVADVMELVDENRAIVALGLAAIKTDPRPGIAALLASAGVQADDINASTIGFTIGPRLNALGRLEDANVGVRLLLGDDPQEATELATEIEALNNQRRELVEQISQAAIQQANELSAAPVLVVAGENWHEGVLGIVASKLVEATGKPSIVLNIENDVMKGSARSTPAFDIFKAMDPHRDLYTAFGGHASAAGMTIPLANLQAVRELLVLETDKQHLAEAKKPELMIAAEVTGQAFNTQNYDMLQVLAPFGEGNPEPLFAVKLTGVENVKTMSDDKHLRLTGLTLDKPLPIVAFGKGGLAPELNGKFDALTFVGTMTANTFRGQTTYQLQVKDVEAVGASILDWRTTKLTAQVLNKNAAYIFFNQKMYTAAKPLIKAPSEALWWEDAFNKTQLGTMALVDVPASIEQLQELLAFVPAKQWAPIFYKKHPAYLQKVPTQVEFAKVYKFFLGHTNLQVKAQFKAMADYLQVDQLLLSLIIQVFLDAQFVTIVDGLINPVATPAKTDLTKTPSYQHFMQQRELEQRLVYSTTNELNTLLTKLSTQTAGE